MLFSGCRPFQSPGGLSQANKLRVSPQGQIQNRGAAMPEATDQQIYEAISMMSMFAGLPASTRAMELARGVLDDKGDESE